MTRSRAASSHQVHRIAGVLAALLPLANLHEAKAQESANAAPTHSVADLWSDQREFTRIELLNMLGGQDADARAYAAARLGDIAADSASIEALARALHDQSEDVRFQAMASLSRLGEDAAPALGRALGEVVNPAGNFAYHSEGLNGNRVVPLTVADLAYTAITMSQYQSADRLMRAIPHLRSLAGDGAVVAMESGLSQTRYSVRQDPQERAWLALLSQPSPSSRTILQALRARHDESLPTPPSDERQLSSARQAYTSGDRIRIAAILAAARVENPSQRLLDALASASSDQKTAEPAACSLLHIGDRGASRFQSLRDAREPSARHAWLSFAPIGEAETQPFERALSGNDAEARAIVLRRLLYDFVGCRYAVRASVTNVDVTSLFVDVRQLSTNADPNLAADAAGILISSEFLNTTQQLAETPLVLATLARGDLALEQRIDIVNALTNLQSRIREQYFHDHRGITMEERSPNEGDPPLDDASLETLLQTMEHLPAPSNLRASGAAADDREEVANTLGSTLKRSLIELLGGFALTDAQARRAAPRLLPQLNDQEGYLPLGEGKLLSALADEVINHEARPLTAGARGLLLLSASRPEASALLLQDFALVSDEARPDWARRLAEAGIFNDAVIDTLSATVRAYHEQDYDQYQPADAATRALNQLGAPGWAALESIALDPTASTRAQDIAVENLTIPEGGAPVARAALERIAQRSRRAELRASATANLARGQQGQDRSDVEANAQRADMLLRAGRVQELAQLLTAAPDTSLDQDVLMRLATQAQGPGAATLARTAASRATPGDPARDALLLRLMQSESGWYGRSQAVQLVMPADRASIAWLAAQLRTHRSRSPDDDDTFTGLGEDIARLAPQSPELQSALADLASHGQAAFAIDMAGNLNTPELTNAFRRSLQDPDESDRVAAANRLDPFLQLTTHTAEGGVVYAATVDRAIRLRLGAVIDELYPPNGTLMSGPSVSLPRFPWPPPRGYKDYVLPQAMVAGPDGSMGDAADAIVAALSRASGGAYTHGFFSGPDDGYVLLARMERIYPDGRPLQGRARWMTSRASMSFVDVISELFFEKPGYFRVIAFVVTANPFGPGADAQLPDPLRGGRALPDEIARTRLGERRVHAVIYSFERQRDGGVRVWSQGSPDPRAQLSAAGVLSALQSGAERAPPGR